jgi:transposase
MRYKNLNKKEFAQTYPTTPIKELIKKYRVNRKTLYTWANRMGLKKDLSKNRGKNYTWSKKQEILLLKWYGKKKYTTEELAELLNHSRWGCINKYRELTGKTNKKSKTL